MTKSPSTSASDAAPAGRAVVLTGLGGLTFWLATGLGLEALQAFKTPAYLQDPVRRLLFTLAHAHGTLLSALTLLLALVVYPRVAPAAARRASGLFAAGAVLLPVGFALSGVVHPEGDPNPAILLVPAGAACCLASLAMALWDAAHRDGRQAPSKKQ